MKRLESELENIAWMTYSVKEDSVGLDMWYEWITSVYHDRRYTGRFWGSRGSRPFACKLEEHRQQGIVKDGNHLGGSRGGSSKQTRMVSKCGPMHPLGCGLNQGQGQWTHIVLFLRYWQIKLENGPCLVGCCSGEPIRISGWNLYCKNKSDVATIWWKLHDPNFNCFWLIPPPHVTDRRMDGTYSVLNIYAVAC